MKRPNDKSAMIQKHIDQYAIRVLVSREDGEFVARALELDLLGYGQTPDAALKELVAMIDCQVSFARQKGIESILFPAPKEYYKRWETAHSLALKRSVSGKNFDETMKLSYSAVTVTVDLKKASEKQVEFVQEPQLA